jgi:hypothetical protein
MFPSREKTTGDQQGSLKNGKRVGSWVSYHPNGQLSSKGTYNEEKRDGPGQPPLSGPIVILVHRTAFALVV